MGEEYGKEDNHSDHDEYPRPSECRMCEKAQEELIKEYGWMAHAVKSYNESIKLARTDLDMPYASEQELMHGIQMRLK